MNYFLAIGSFIVDLIVAILIWKSGRQARKEREKLEKENGLYTGEVIGIWKMGMAFFWLSIILLLLSSMMFMVDVIVGVLFSLCVWSEMWVSFYFMTRYLKTFVYSNQESVTYYHKGQWVTKSFDEFGDIGVYTPRKVSYVVLDQDKKDCFIVYERFVNSLEFTKMIFGNIISM